MPLTRNVVLEIQQFLATEGDLDRQRLGNLVWTYAEICRSMNERSQKCLDLLRQGRRQDALKLAKQDLDLKEEIVLLDFPERFTWLDLCERAGTPVADIIDTAALYRLVEELYAESGTLSQLLRLHRRGAIGGAPLVARLKVLRQLRQVDPGQGVWDEDLRAYEAARVAEIKKQADVANLRGDLATLEPLVAELRAQDWFVPPPPELARAIEKVMIPHRRKAAMARFEGIATEVRAAHSNQDRARCLQAVQTWDNLCQQTGFTPDPKLLNEVVSPARSWLGELQTADDEDARFDKACKDLEASMNEGLPRHVVEGRATAVLRMNRRMPPVLAQRYNTCIAEAGRRGKRTFITLLAGIAAVFILVAGSVTAYLYLTSRSEELTATIKALDEATAKPDVDAALLILATVARDKPHVYADAEVQARALRIIEMQKKRDAFVQLADAAKAACAKLKADVAAAPNPAAALDLVRAARPAIEEPLKQARAQAISPEQTAQAGGIDQDLAELSIRASIDELKAAATAAANPATALVQVQDRRADIDAQLDRAKVAAQKPDERRRIEELRQELAQFVDKATGSHEGLLREQLQQLTADYAKLAQDTESPDEAWQARAAGLQEKVAKLLATRDLSNAVKTDAASLVANVQKMIDEHKAIKIALGRITNLFDQPDTLARELTDFTEKFPQHPLTPDFKRAGGMAPNWRAVAAWQSFAGTWGSQIRVHESAIIRLRANQIDKFMADHPDSPYKDSATAYRAYLEVAKDAMVNNQLHYLRETIEYVSQFYVSGVQALRLRDGRCYYPTRASLGGGPNRDLLTIDYIINAKPDKETKSASFTADKLDGPVHEAPQAQFAAKAAKLMSQFRGPGWETFYLQLADLVIQQSDMDPILASKTLKEKLLTYAAPGTPFKTEAINQLATRWDQVDLDTPLWMDPDDANANRIRPQAALILKNLGSFQPLVTDVEGRLAAMCKAVTAHQPVGLILKADLGLRLPQGATDGTLLALWSPDGSAPKFDKVGTVEGGKAKIDPNGVGRYPKGTPVYFSAK